MVELSPHVERSGAYFNSPKSDIFQEAGYVLGIEKKDMIRAVKVDKPSSSGVNERHESN